MKYLEGVAISILLVFTPIKSVLLTVLVLVLADLVAGVWMAWRRGEKITSNGFRRSLVKILTYEMAIAVGFLAETFLIGDLFPVTKVISALVGLTELKSLLEHLGELNGNKSLSELVTKLPGVDKIIGSDK